MNKVNKIILFLLLATLSIYSQTKIILFIQPKGPQHKKMELGIKSSLNQMSSVISTCSRSETEIIKLIKDHYPALIVAAGLENIRILDKIYQKHTEIQNIPYILVQNELPGEKIDIKPNSCVISYETKFRQYLEQFIYYTGKKPQNIGIIYSTRSNEPLVHSYHNEASNLGVNLYSKNIIISDPGNSIRTIIRNFTDHYKIDGLIILKDDAVINNQNISTLWQPLLRPLRIPVAVPSDYFYEIEPRIGSFAIQPHYSEIGKVIASLWYDASANNWSLRHKSVYTDKSIFFFREAEGAISRQNFVDNKILATYYPQNTGPKAIFTPSPSVAMADVSDKPSLSECAPAIPEIIEEKKEVSLAIIETFPAVKEDIGKKTATISSSFPSNKKESVSNNNTHRSKTEEKKKETVKVYKPPEIPESKISLEDNIQTKQPVHPTPTNRHFTPADYRIIILSDTAFIYKELSPGSPVLGIARAGDRMKVKSEDSLWYCVNFMGESGFVLKAEAQRYSEESPFATILFPKKLVVITAISIPAIILFLFIGVVLFRHKKRKNGRISCLLISKNPKKVKYSSINNTSISLSKYLRNYGFKVINSRTFKHASSFLHLNIPEIICVDWEFSLDIQEKMNEMLRFEMLTEDFFLIYYNVTDPVSSNIKGNGYFNDRTFFLGKKLTISDINSILTMLNIKPEQNEENSDNSKSYLEGKISENTLNEIFQLMDTNKKTGCLIIENHRPLGLIFFEDGIITFAVTEKQAAEEAVFELLSIKHGRFHFLPDKKPATRQMHLDTFAVLIERAKRDDEICTGPKAQ